MAIKGVDAEVSGRRGVFFDGPCEGGLRSRGMTVEAARPCSKYRMEWRSMVHM